MDTAFTSGDLTFWEGVAKTRWGRYLTEVEARVLERARELAGPPGTALEVGAEGGRWSAELQRAGWDMICTDVDPRTLGLCAERLPAARCLVTQTDATTLPCETDEVTLLLVYEVAPVTQSDWFPREAARVLKPGGVLVCSYDNPHSVRAQAFKAISVFDSHRRAHRSRHYAGPSYADFRNALTANGFGVLQEVGIGWCPFPRESNSILIPPCVTVERISGLRRMPRVSPWVLVIARRIADAVVP